MRPCICAYIPPRGSFPYAQAFFENLKKYPPKLPLYLYADTAGWPDTIKVPTPEQVKNMVDPRTKLLNRFAVNNAVFFTGLRVALRNNCTHMLYLEADCRVGRAGWDEAIFDEFFNLGRAVIAAGTLMVYNPCNHNLKAAKRWEELVSRNHRRNVPIATYGWMGAAAQGPSCVFPNGAFSVLDVAWMSRLFDLNDTIGEAIAAFPNPHNPQNPWDMAIGRKIWDRFDADAFDVVGHLSSVYSSYGDVLTNEAERIHMLRSGKIVGVHQVKSEVAI